MSNPPIVSTGARALWVLVMLILAGVVGVLIVYNAPVIGLTTKTKASEAVNVVLGSTALWLVAVSVVLALISAVWAAVWPPEGYSALANQLLNVLAAFFAMWAGIYGVPPLLAVLPHS